MKIKLFTVCTDAYPTEYARKLITRYRQLSNHEVEAICITDRPKELKDIATCIPPLFPGKGWWNKMQVYGDSSKGNKVYLDIDTVLIDNFDEEVEWSLNQDCMISVVSDAIQWKGNKYSSSMMVWKDAAMVDTYNKFLLSTPTHYDGGDQVWTGHNIDLSKVVYIDEEFPNIKANLKFHLSKKVFGQWQIPGELPRFKRIKIVDCGGRPKPHELEHIPYIKENWHDIITDN